MAATEAIRHSLETKLDQAVQADKARAKYAEGRYGVAIVLDALTRQEWDSLLPSDLRWVLGQYLGGPEFELLRAEIICVPPQSPPQEFYKDHNVGSEVSACVAISIKRDSVVGTLLRPGSHKTKEAEVDTDTVTATQSSFLVYDTYADHAGGPNLAEEPNTSRIFLTFRSPALPPSKKGQLTRALKTSQDPQKPLPFHRLTKS